MKYSGIGVGQAVTVGEGIMMNGVKNYAVKPSCKPDGEIEAVRVLQ